MAEAMLDGTYRFDRDAVEPEITAIIEWLRLNGIDPTMVPSNARIHFAGGAMTIDVQMLNDSGYKYLGPDNWTVLGTTTVPVLVEPPVLKSLLPFNEEKSND